jgi:DNA-binding Lrp family transcriptional regulator
VGHNLADQGAIQDYVASINPDALAGLAVIVKIQLTRQDERIVTHCRAEL